MTDIVNAAPMVIDQGTDDHSRMVVRSSSLMSPQHLPKFYLFAEKGPIGPNFIDLSTSTLTDVYGDDTFNVNTKYYTHQTPFAQVVASAGNNLVIHRLVPDDAKDVANVAFYLDVLPTQVPIYDKNTDGSVKLDTNGDPITKKDTNGDDITVNGFKVCWVTDFVVRDINHYEQGQLIVRNGVQVDGATQSQQYPIFEISAKDVGEYGNKLAVKLYPALQTDQYPFPTNFLNDSKIYPYYITIVRLIDPETGKTRPVLNGYGSQFSRFGTKKDAVDPTSGLMIDFTKIVEEQYLNTTMGSASGIGKCYTYYDNLNQLVEQFYDSEKIITDTFRDSLINTTEQNYHGLNILSFTSSNGSPYQSIKVVDESNSVRLTKNTNVFLKGAFDGSVSESLMDTLVDQDMELYNDYTSEYNDIVLHPESIIYDTGFTLSTKKSLAKFISRRKDTFVTLATFSHNNQASLIADQYSIGIALKTMMELYPESSTFGTPVMRGMIIGGSGEIVNHPYKKRVPLSYEIAYKSSRYMGASNGAWKNGYSFDRAPNSIITQLKNIDSGWVPAVTRNAMWSAGLNFALNYKIKTQFFPALQTVYEDDTSVLNSYFTAVAISYLNKIAHSAWREFTGSIGLTNAQLEEKVNAYVYEMVKDKFDDKFVIVPDAKVTEEDALRGFSWSLGIKIFSNNLKTVMTTHVESYRMSDLNQ